MKIKHLFLRALLFALLFLAAPPSPAGTPTSTLSSAAVCAGGLDTTFNADVGETGLGNPIVNAIALQPDGKSLIAGAFSRYNGVSRNGIARLNSDGSLDPSFNPGSGIPGVRTGLGLNALVLQPDGKILIGGFFSKYDGVSRHGIARLNSDGSLDTSFDARTKEFTTIAALALQPDGKILVGSNSTQYNGVSRNGIARLNSDGSLDPSFDPGSGTNIGSVSDLALQPDGKILIAGNFTQYNGVSRNGFARLDSNGSLDTSFFAPNTDSGVSAFALQLDGKILIAGFFTQVNGVSRNRIARLNSGGSLDTSFNPGTGPNIGEFTAVNDLALQSDGKILIGGGFTQYNGVSRKSVARLSSDGSLDTSFDPGPGANHLVSALALQSDGSILIVGEFTRYNVAGVPRNGIARINTDGGADTSFHSGSGASFDSEVLALALQPDGKILIGGSFIEVNGVSRPGIARLNSDGTIDTSFNPGAAAPDAEVDVLALQPDGKILIGGFFVEVGGVTRNSYARLNSDGSHDPSFNSGNAEKSFVFVLALQPDGKILIFSTQLGMARLNSDGSVDPSFNPGTGPNYFLEALALQPDGKILIGGFFTEYNGVSRNGIARLNSDGSLDPSFDPGSGTNIGIVHDFAFQPDGKILIGGDFNGYNGVTRYGVARVNSDGSLDTSFDPGIGVDGRVEALALQPDGKILIAGAFSDYNGVTRYNVARVNSDGSLDTSFDPGAGPNGSVGDLALQPDGKTLITGSFTQVNGAPRNHVARLDGDSNCPAAAPAQVLNISTRMDVGTGDRVMIGGFIITGNVSKPVVLRGLGPSLTGSQIAADAVLADPVLALHGPDGALIMQNDNWMDDQRPLIEGTIFQPTDDRESVIVATLPPGNYTAILTGKNQTTGVGLVEVYDNDPAIDAQLANISTRGFVQTADNVMIGGFTLGGNTGGASVAVRGIGPSLATFALSNVLTDPTLELHNMNGTTMISNDNWTDDTISAGQLAANGLALQHPKEAGIFTSLPPGPFTAILAGKNGGLGIGLVEIYNVP